MILEMNDEKQKSKSSCEVFVHNFRKGPSASTIIAARRPLSCSSDT